ncbi:MAG: hypothetical protein GC134_00530 [Proteobacteria bacterium]|nr:hypothetical protein [Pseudomonadota bacterium]
MQQLVLSFPRKTSFEVEDYMPFTSHGSALALLAQMAQTGGMGYVYGPEGTGKSHFLHVAAGRLGLPYYTPATLPADPTRLSEAVIDDVHALDAVRQQAVFHLFNRLKEEGGVLLLGAAVPAASLTLLPDLTSRLRTLTQVEIPLPEEADLNILLAKLAYDRQLLIEPAVGKYLMTRAERSPVVIEGVLDRLDTLSLARKKGITIPMVRQVLDGAEATSCA